MPVTKTLAFFSRELGKLVAQGDVSEPHPVDVLLDEQLFAHVRVVPRLNGRDDDDVVHRRIGGVLLAVSQHARDDARPVSIERAHAETAGGEELLRRVEDVAAAPDVEQEAQRDSFRLNVFVRPIV